MKGDIKTLLGDFIRDKYFNEQTLISKIFIYMIENILKKYIILYFLLFSCFSLLYLATVYTFPPLYYYNGPIVG